MIRVLVTPLDWGLGHATRCIPVIRSLIDHDCEVLIAGSGDSLRLLQAEFPDIDAMQINGYEPVYQSSGSMVLKMALQLPKFIRTISLEHKVIEKIIRDKKISLLISDNRYGAWSAQIPCVLITHQSNILMPRRFGWLQGIVRYFNHRQMKKFSVCWIPDFPGAQNLADQLISFGDTKDLKVEFLGALSRFRKKERAGDTFQYKILVVLSGPEPQRTILENLIIPQLQQSRLKYFVVRGKLYPEKKVVDPNVVDFLSTSDLQEKIESSEIVICRSGYSSIMDLAALGKKAILIPTPGQTEQEYLAQTLMKKGIANAMSQRDFDLAKAVEQNDSFTGFTNFKMDDSLLNSAIKRILTRIKEPKHAAVL